jgi:hypothetical protein
MTRSSDKRSRWTQSTIIFYTLKISSGHQLPIDVLVRRLGIMAHLLKKVSGKSDRAGTRTLPLLALPYHSRLDWHSAVESAKSSE